MSTLFSPYALGPLALRNRIAIAPMCQYSATDGNASDWHMMHLVQLATSGAGLLVIEATAVEDIGRITASDLGLYSDANQAALVPVLAAIRRYSGIKVAVQLAHAGRKASSQVPWQGGQQIAPGAPGGWNTVAPSALPHGPTELPPLALDDAGLARVKAAFVQAAQRAHALGIDAIELHGAHGYLIDQFFWDGTNLREDAYGSKDLPGRARFAGDILKAVRKEVGPDYPVIIRISQWKQQDYEVKLAQDPKALEAWLGALVDAGADILHCSQRRFWEPEFEGSDLNFAGWAKKLTGVPTITVGSVGLSGEFIAAFAGEGSKPASLDELERRLDRGDFDLVGVGRALLQDPDWVLKIRDGRTDELKSFERAALGTLY